MSLTLTGIALHPVKSTAIRPVGSAVVRPDGLAGDRRWMVVDAAGNLVSARELRGLFHVVADTPETEAGLAGLRLRAPGLDVLDVSAPTGERVPVRMHGHDLTGRPADDETHDWLGRATGRTGLRLVWCEDQTPYPDSGPVTLASSASLRQLNDWITHGALERGETPVAAVPMDRFRPNLVIDGDVPFEEDGWSGLRIGEVTFRAPRRVDRCVMTTIDPVDLTSTKEPIRTLARHRLSEQATWFAIALVPLGTGVITVGDPLTVL
ncbi:MAG: MOSC domain-containing protein [Propionibacteriales bacterium]|nr:MOSC domain-containing protein [Propionibacteriales bacterium]